MENNKFFKFVWRFNGIAIMVVIIIAILMMGGSIVGGLWRKQEPGITNLAKDPDGQEKWKLGNAQKIRNRIVLIPLVSELEYVKVGMGSVKAGLHSYSDSYSGRNLLFVDGESNQSKWLYSTNNQMITSYKLLSEDNEYRSNKVNNIVYEVVAEDTNQDKSLTGEDLISIAFSSFDGGNYKVVVDKVTRLIDISQVGPDKILLIYQKNNIGYSATYSSPGFTLITQKELPKTE